MNYSMFALITISIFTASDVFACDGVHLMPGCPAVDAPVPVQTTPALKTPKLRVSDGGYATGNNCFLSIEVDNDDDTNAVAYHVEMRHLTGEWIALPVLDGQKKVVYEVAEEFATTKLELRARSQGVFVMPYDGKPLLKFSEFTAPVQGFCQSD